MRLPPGGGAAGRGAGRRLRRLLFASLRRPPSSQASRGSGAAGFTPPAPRKRKKIVRDFVPATATRVPGAPGGEPVEVKFRIYVLGDSFAVATSEGLTEAFADKREIAVVDKAREASGLVRDDYFDWRKTSAELATGKEKIDFVVVMLGVNDVQPLVDGSTIDPLSDRWREIYSQRVEAVVAPFPTAHIPVAWVGLPPMRSEKFNAAAIKLNEIYKEQAEKADEKYIDIWDAFSNQGGQYDAFGPNIDGQSVKLRGVDGIQFTKAGSRKVAQFLGGGNSADVRKKQPAIRSRKSAARHRTRRG